MMIAHGDGSNGKNVLLDTLKELLGDYYATLPPAALMAQRYELDPERPTAVAASLAGARIVVTSESREGKRLDVTTVKQHTGNKYMTARRMRENPFTFEVTHKLWLMTNHRPALDHLDEALRGRLHLVPFDRRWNRPGHPEHDPALPDGDPGLLDKLKVEAEGILAWLVAGAIAYAREGLEPPAEVTRTTRAYFLEQDPVGRWLEGFEPSDPKKGPLASELYENFRGWCSAEDESAELSMKAFASALERRGVIKAATNAGKRYGLRARRGGEGSAMANDGEPLAADLL